MITWKLGIHLVELRIHKFLNTKLRVLIYKELSGGVPVRTIGIFVSKAKSIVVNQVFGYKSANLNSPISSYSNLADKSPL